MPVVINEFEVVGAPAPSADKGTSASASPGRQEPDALEMAALLRVERERVLRVRAH